MGLTPLPDGPWACPFGFCDYALLRAVGGSVHPVTMDVTSLFLLI